MTASSSSLRDDLFLGSTSVLVLVSISETTLELLLLLDDLRMLLAVVLVVMHHEMILLVVGDLASALPLV